MKYKVVTKCFWNKKVWEEGDIVELSEVPPKHFIAYIDSEVIVKPKVVDIMAAVPMEIGKPIKPEGGMGHSMKYDIPKPMLTESVAKVEEKEEAVKIDKRTRAWRDRK